MAPPRVRGTMAPPRSRGGRGSRRRGDEGGSSQPPPPEFAPQWYRDLSTSAFEGGPQEANVLFDYQNHIANTIWETGKTTRDVTKFPFHHKPNAFDLWPLSAEKNKIFIRKCEESGLAILWEAKTMHLNKPLVHSLLERWMPETNTFHLNVGEATITLDDIFKITGLKIEGELLMGEKAKNDEGYELAERLLGLETWEATSNCGDGNVGINWLWSEFKGELAEDVTDEEEIDWYVRAYLLYALGCTLFSDKSGSKISLTWLRDLEDMKTIPEIA